MPEAPVEFHIRINGGEEQTISVASGVYMHAAAALPAMLGLDLPIDVEIWVPDLLPIYRPFHYRVAEDAYGSVTVRHMIPA